MYSRPKCSSFDELDILIQKVTNKADKEFDSLVSSLNINKEKNKEWAAAYYSLVEETKKLSKSIRRLKVWKWILLIPLIFPFFLMNNAQKKKQPILNEKTAELKKTEAELHKQLDKFRTLLTYDFAYNKIISEAWEDAKLDLYIDKQAGNWEYDYSTYMIPDSCATSLVSGTLFEHPFVLMNRKVQSWHPHVYTGSLPVTYTVYVDGKAQTRTQVVVATVTLPEPDWKHTPYFVYRSSKPLNLSFCNDLSAKALKKMNKKGSAQPMENAEFDKIFPASRNNELEYRVVFTPVAQEGFVKLFQHANYSISKEKEATCIFTDINLVDNDFSDDTNYDLETWKKKYCDWVGRLVKHIACFSLPIANMPVYYQMDYQSHQGKTPSRLQAQNNADWICETYGLTNSFETDVIYECDNYDTYSIDKNKVISNKINCNYFHPNHRVQMVPTPSQRGMVMVPVHVVDYLPRTKSLFIYSITNPKYKDIEIITDSYAIHSGQLLLWSWKPINSAAIKKIVESI